MLIKEKENVMSYREPDFAAQVALRVKQYWQYPNVAAELNAITAALAADVTTHSKVIEQPPAALAIHHFVQTPFTNDINVLVNKGKAGNLTVNQMVSGIDDAIGVLHKPAIIDIPYASANAKPPIVGTLCSVTNGNWTGAPTGYTYQWTRSGSNIAAATSATYTLVAADVGGKFIACVVTAANAQGSTAAPPSNAVAT
jgi:hypothetical protein